MESEEVVEEVVEEAPAPGEVSEPEPQTGIRVTRLEAYPRDNSTGNCVGFTVTCTNGQSFYVDTVIPFTEASGTDDAVRAALQQLKSGINSRKSALEGVDPLVNSNVSLPETDVITEFKDDGDDATDATIVLTETQDLEDNDEVVIADSGESSYNGTHTIAGVEKGASYKIPVAFTSNPEVKGTSKKNVAEE